MPKTATLSETVDTDLLSSELVSSFTKDELLVIFKEYIGTKQPSTKDDISYAVAAYFAQHLKQQFETADKLQKLALGEALHSENGYDPETFEAKHGKSLGSDVLGWKAKPSLMKVLTFATNFGRRYVRPSLRKALTKFVEVPQEAQMKTLLELPDAYQHEVVKEVWQEDDDGILVQNRNSLFKIPRKEPRKVKSVEQIPMEIAERAERAQSELWSVLKLIKEGKISVAEKSKQPSPDVMFTISRALEKDFYQNLPVEDFEEISFIRSFAWPMLIQAAGLTAPVGKKLALTKTGMAALSTEPSVLIKSIWKAWISSSFFDEFRRIDIIKGQTGKAQKSFTKPALRRSTIIRSLEGCPANEWMATIDFSHFMLATGNSFNVTSDAWKLYIGEPDHGSLGYAESWTWENFEEPYLYCFLFEYAATLGLIDVAYVDPNHCVRELGESYASSYANFFSRYEGLVYFKINALGEYCLDRTNFYERVKSSGSAALSARPNLRIELVRGTLAMADAMVIDTFAEQVADNTWEMSQEKSLIAAESGQRILELREILERLDDQPLPQQFEKFIDNIEKRWNACRSIGSAVLFECAKAADAKEIASHSLTKKLCLLTDSQTLVVKKVDEQKFRKALHLLGIGTGLN